MEKDKYYRKYLKYKSKFYNLKGGRNIPPQCDRKWNVTPNESQMIESYINCDDLKELQHMKKLLKKYPARFNLKDLISSGFLISNLSKVFTGYDLLKNGASLKEVIEINKINFESLEKCLDEKIFTVDDFKNSLDESIPNELIKEKNSLSYHKYWISLFHKYIKNNRMNKKFDNIVTIEEPIVNSFLDNKNQNTTLLGLRAGLHPISLIKNGFEPKDVLNSLCKNSFPSNEYDWNEHPKWEPPFRIYKFLKNCQLYTFINLCIETKFDIKDLFSNYNSIFEDINKDFDSMVSETTENIGSPQFIENKDLLLKNFFFDRNGIIHLLLNMEELDLSLQDLKNTGLDIEIIDKFNKSEKNIFKVIKKEEFLENYDNEKIEEIYK